jgi:hypothetical protein
MCSGTSLVGQRELLLGLVGGQKSKEPSGEREEGGELEAFEKKNKSKKKNKEEDVGVDEEGEVPLTKQVLHPGEYGRVLPIAPLIRPEHDWTRIVGQGGGGIAYHGPKQVTHQAKSSIETSWSGLLAVAVARTCLLMLCQQPAR